MKLDKGQIEVMDDAMADVLKLKSGSERLQIASNLWKFGKDMIRANVISKHPDWACSEIDKEVSRRLLNGSDVDKETIAVAIQNHGMFNIGAI